MALLSTKVVQVGVCTYLHLFAHHCSAGLTITTSTFTWWIIWVMRELTDSFLLMFSIWPTIIICLGSVYFIKVTKVSHHVSGYNIEYFPMFAITDYTASHLPGLWETRQATIRVEIFPWWTQSASVSGDSQRDRSKKIINICYDHFPLSSDHWSDGERSKFQSKF